MEDNQQPCTIEDVEAVVPRWDRWSVDKDGNPVDIVSEGSFDEGNIEEYQCSNCGENFTPDKPFNTTSLNEAWQAAIAHIGGTPE